MLEQVGNTTTKQKRTFIGEQQWSVYFAELTLRGEAMRGHSFSSSCVSIHWEWECTLWSSDTDLSPHSPPVYSLSAVRVRWGHSGTFWDLNKTPVGVSNTETHLNTLKRVRVSYDVTILHTSTACGFCFLLFVLGDFKPAQSTLLLAYYCWCHFWTINHHLAWRTRLMTFSPKKVHFKTLLVLHHYYFSFWFTNWIQYYN